MESKAEKIKELLEKHEILMVAHYYQKDAVVDLAHFLGDSLQLAREAARDVRDKVLFCGVGFMGESVKILSPKKLVFMPKIACCSMARMISSEYFDRSIEILEKYGIKNTFPMTYINSSAEVKAKVGRLGGVVCTSANAKKIFAHALEMGRKIFFLPDKCLGHNLARDFGLKSSVLGIDSKDAILESDVICYDGFCSVHQLFSTEDVDFYRDSYPNILIVSHPECKPEVVEKSDFCGSTSQIIDFVNSLPTTTPVAIATEINLVNRLRRNGLNNTFVLSSTIPECPTMSETDVDDILKLLLAYDRGNIYNEITLQDDVVTDAKGALERMLELS